MVESESAIDEVCRDETTTKHPSSVNNNDLWTYIG